MATKVQVKDKNGSLITVYDTDIPALIAEGTLPKGTVSPTATKTVATPIKTASTPTVQKATLYGPNGQKQVVDVGSTQASQLQSQGWGLTVGSYKAPISPVPSDNPTGSDNPASGATNSQSMIDYMISIDPYLQDYFSDPANKAKFDTLDPALQSTFLQLIDVKQKNIAAGKIVNPDVTLEPDKMAEFLQTAKDQLDPYYQEQLKNVEGDLTTSIQRLQDDYNTSIGRSQDTFKQNLGTQAESEAQAGLTYGSERGVRLGRTIENENNALADTAKSTQRSIQDIATADESSIGSSNLAGLGINYNTPTYTADANGYTSTGTRSLFTPAGNLTGSMANEETTNEILKQQQLAAAENAKRTADYNFQVNSINA